MTPGEQSAALYGPPTKPRDEAKPETVRIAPFTAEPAIPHETIRERQTLRQTADALPLLEPAPPDLGNDEQFTRLTRRALSNLGDLPKLAKSPLVNLPGIEGTNPLDRAHALRSLLIKSIQKLKPQSEARFGTTDEWRYYNALYFPYVLGLKPYTRRLDFNSLDESSRAALDWFQASVPERTLHNWQNAAAQLIAEDLLAVIGSGLRGLGSTQSLSWAEKEKIK